MLNSSALIEDLHTLTMFTFSLVGIDLISDTITNNKVMTHKKEFFTTKFRAYYIYIYIYTWWPITSTACSIAKCTSQVKLLISQTLLLVLLLGKMHLCTNTPLPLDNLIITYKNS